MTASQPPADTAEPFGRYGPSYRTAPLRALIRLGVSRGMITKTIRNLWVRLDGRIVDCEVSGILYRLDVLDNVTDMKVLMSSKTYDKKEIHHLTNACHNSIFVDVGANTGYYSLSLLKRGALKVVAIEPNPKTLERLRFNMAINGWLSSSCVVPEGVGPSGTLDFYLHPGLGSASFIPSPESSGTISVDTRPLTEILASLGISKTNGMKIDVEGFEDRALVPFLGDCRHEDLPETIVLETCNSDHWLEDPVHHLNRNGYHEVAHTRANAIYQLA
jgi:FkbM family methyltransferase